MPTIRKEDILSKATSETYSNIHTGTMTSGIFIDDYVYEYSFRLTTICTFDSTFFVNALQADFRSSNTTILFYSVQQLVN